MNYLNKNLAIYYHMPFRINAESDIYANPVMGTFIHSMAPYFNKIVVFGFETIQKNEVLTYQINHIQNVKFISLGLNGRFWDYFSKLRRMKTAIRQNKVPIDMMLLRVPSQLAYLVWKLAGMPLKTSIMLIGNQFFTPDYNNYSSAYHQFFRWRSDLHDRRLGIICRKSNILAMANSGTLCKIWEEELKVPVESIHTSSLSKDDLISLNLLRDKFTGKPYKILFVGRVCFDKGIRELMEAVEALNQEEKGSVLLDVVGPVGDLGGREFKQITNEFNVTDFVKYHGAVPFGPAIFDYYKNADVYILPSYHEGMPKTIWEALSQGTPVIASALDGILENFVNGEEIMFAEPRNSDSIIAAFKRLRQSPELVKNLQVKGRKKVELITRERQAEQIIRLMTNKWS